MVVPADSAALVDPEGPDSEAPVARVVLEARDSEAPVARVESVAPDSVAPVEAPVEAPDSEAPEAAPVPDRHRRITRRQHVRITAGETEERFDPP